MRITPLDIRKQEFRRTMRGLDADEVYAFLGTVSEEYEAVLSDNKRLREHIVQLEERLKEFKTMETNLRNTLLTAERITSEAKENARREAELIVRAAEVEANKATETIRAHTQQLRREILELKKHKDNYATRLRTLLEGHMRVVEGFTEDFAEVDKEIEAIGRKVEQDTRSAAPAPRMSRERITEDIATGEASGTRTAGEASGTRAAGEAAGKATWGEEWPSEEIERPTMPRPGRRQQGAPGRPSSSGAEPEQALLGSRSPQPAERELDFGPGRTAPGWPPVVKDGPGTAGREGWPAEKPEQGAMDRMEPKAPMDRPGQEPVSAEAQSPVAVSDEWRSYEVKSERQDWSSYEVPRAAAPPRQQGAGQGAHPQQAVGETAPQKPSAWPAAARPHADPPDEIEVEQALSGLTESADHADRGGKAQVHRPPGPQPDPQRQAPMQTAAPSAEPAPESGAARDEEETAWTMEQLRRNLSNIDRDT